LCRSYIHIWGKKGEHNGCGQEEEEEEEEEEQHPFQRDHDLKFVGLYVFKLSIFIESEAHI
jgi:hypothetical protein